MLVNITSEHYHPLLKEKAKEAFPDDQSMFKYLETINGKNFHNSKYAGIMICGSLNPRFCTPPSYDLEDISYITLSKPIDKRNRKFRNTLGFRQTEHHLKSWDEIKDLSSEEHHKLQTTYTGKYYFKGYGVCDNEDQVYRYYRWLEDQDEEYCIILTPIFKKHQSPHGGWRWEKWGKYIGNQKSKADYLYDEPDIDMVFVFSVYQITRNELLHTSSEGIKIYKYRKSFEIEDAQGRSLGLIRKVKEDDKWYQVGYHSNPFFYSQSDEFEDILPLLKNCLGVE